VQELVVAEPVAAGATAGPELEGRRSLTTTAAGAGCEVLGFLSDVVAAADGAGLLETDGRRSSGAGLAFEGRRSAVGAGCDPDGRLSLAERDVEASCSGAAPCSSFFFRQFLHTPGRNACCENSAQAPFVAAAGALLDPALGGVGVVDLLTVNARCFSVLNASALGSGEGLFVEDTGVALRLPTENTALEAGCLLTASNCLNGFAEALTLCSFVGAMLFATAILAAALRVGMLSNSLVAATLLAPPPSPLLCAL
jgi:hypothetical protein